MKKKKYYRLLSLLFAFQMLLTSCASQNNNVTDDSSTIALIPLPLEYYLSEGDFVLEEDCVIYVVGNTEDETNQLHRTAEYLAKKFRTSTGYSLPVNNGQPSSNTYILLTTVDGDVELGNEGYQLTVTPNHITLLAYQPEGAFRGIQTLRQLFPASIEKSEVVNDVIWSVPCSEIRDKPEYDYRSTQLDVARHFFTVDEVKRHIDNIVQYKINTLHLHLTDDQGWRLEINGSRYGEDYSALTEIGGSTCAHYILEDDGTCSGKGGYYTQDDFKELVSYAAERYVEIIPEIDMPGHAWAALSSLNFLNPNGVKQNGPWKGIEVGFSSFDCNAESTYQFIEDVISQISEISPSKYIHIGGDEANNTSKEDYTYFVNRVTEIAKKYNKIPIGWQDYDQSVEDKETAIGQFWGTSKGNGSNLITDMNYIISPANYAYLDMQYPNDTSGLGLSWAGKISIQKAYEWDPTDYGDKSQIIGVEAPLWTETLRTTDQIDYMVFPRLAGIAEIGWTPKDMRSWKDYKSRLIAQAVRLENQGINFYKDKAIWKN